VNAGATQTTLSHEAVCAELEHQGHLLGAIEAAVTLLARGEPVTDLPPIQAHHEHIWACKGCGRRLGVYDPGLDVLFLKYKDLYLRFQVGVSGWVETQCLSCGRTNRADYTAS
jgi:hypothetical protein